MTQERKPSRFRRVLLAGIAVIGLGAIGAVGAVQAGGPFGGGPFGGAPFGGKMGGPGFGGPFASHMLDRALDRVEASEDQRETIRGIIDEAVTELSALTADMDDRKEQFTALLAAETIDRDAFETLRQDVLATGDAVSSRAMAAFLDAAEVLTPEQRSTLLEEDTGFGRGFGPGFGPRGN